MDDLITRQEIEDEIKKEIEDGAVEEEREILQRIRRKKYGKLRYVLFLILLTLRGLIKGILRIIQKVSFFMLFWSILAYCIGLLGTVEFKIPLIITSIIWTILGFGATHFLWAYDVLLLRLAPPDIDLALYDFD